MKVKAITCRDPTFLKTTYALDHIIDLIDDEKYLKTHERYIKFDGRWRLFRMGSDRIPRHQGIFDNISTAIHKARK